MAKKGGKKGKKGAKKAAPKRMVKQMGFVNRPGGSMAMAMHTCSVTNPFCPEALGAKWPDGSYTRAVTWDINGIPLSVAALASGSTAIMFMGDLGYNTVGAASMSGATATMNASLSQIVVPPTGVARFRVTSWGLKINVNTSLMTTQGSLRARLVSPLTGTSLAAFDTSTPLADAGVDIPLARLVGKDFFVVPMPITDEARQFRTPASTSTVAAWVNPGWQVVCLGVTGTTASLAEAIVVTAYYHYELVFSDGDASAAFATPAPPKSEAVQKNSTDTLTNIGNFIEGTAQRVDSIFQSTAFKLGSSLALAYSGQPQAAIVNYTGRSSKYVAKDSRHVD